MEKETWKNDVMGSLEGIQRAEPGARVFAAIRAKTAAARMQVVRRPYVALVAACLTLLAVANVLAMREQQRSTISPSLVYQIDNTQFDLYKP